MHALDRQPRRVAILQSSYVPWKGYFDLLASVDDFVLLDSVQYTKNDWRNRNRIKTPRGTSWLTIPIHRPNGLRTRICDAQAATGDWHIRHLEMLFQNYRNAPSFHRVRPFLVELYRTCPTKRLSDINHHFLTQIAEYLGIRTRFWWSMDFDLPQDRNERLVELCRKLQATEYISGPSAEVYLDARSFNASGIDVRFFGYEGFPPYSQVHPPFDPFVSVLDPILHWGEQARLLVLRYLNSSGAKAA